MKNILKFNDFYKSHLQTNEDYINSYINESLSVSYDVYVTSNKIFDDIIAKKSSFKQVQNIPINGYNTKTYQYSSPQIVKIFGCDCLLNLFFIDIEDDLSFSELKKITKDNTQMTMNRINSAPNQRPDTPVQISYELNGIIIMNKMEISVSTKSEISHELTHAFIYYKILNGKTIKDTQEFDLKSKKWTELLLFCKSYQQDCMKNPDSNYMGYGENFYKICYALYSCSPEELNAFTQQAYSEGKEESDISGIKSKLKESELWELICNLKDCKDILNDGYDVEYEKIRKTIDTKLPKISVIKSLINRCYVSAYTSYGKILMKLIDELTEDKVSEIFNKGGYISINTVDGPDLVKYYI